MSSRRAFLSASIIATRRLNNFSISVMCFATEDTLRIVNWFI
jgi:hypothetical protein